jgi:hypothetical protein
MDGLFYILSIIGVGIVMWWVFENDGVPLDRPTKGLFEMMPSSQIARRRKLRGWISSMKEAPPRRKSPF